MSDVSKARRKAQNAIEHDLKELGCVPSNIDVSSAQGVGGRFLSWFAGPGFGDTEEVLCVSANVYDCPVEILVPIAKWGFTPPYLMEIALPVPMTGRAEFRRGIMSNAWRVEPKDKAHVNDLKRTVPKVRMKENQVSKKVPVQCKYSVDIGHCLEPGNGDTTSWVVNSAYEGGLLSGGHRPRVKKFLMAIPAIRAMLETWHDQADGPVVPVTPAALNQSSITPHIRD